MLKAEKNIAFVNTTEMRKSILADPYEKPNFKKKMFGYDAKEVEEFIITLNNVMETTKSSFQTENEQMRSEVFILSKEREKHAKQITEISADRDSQIAEISENCDKQIAAILAERDAQIAEIIADRDRQLGEMSEELSSYKSLSENEINRIKELEDTVASLKDALAEYEEIVNARPDYEKLEQKLVETEQELSAGKAQNSFLVAKNEQLVASLEAKTEETVALYAEVASLKLAAKRRQASLEGSMFSYGRDLNEHLQKIKSHVFSITEMVDTINANCKSTEGLIKETLSQPTE